MACKKKDCIRKLIGDFEKAVRKTCLDSTTMEQAVRDAILKEYDTSRRALYKALRQVRKRKLKREVVANGR